MATKQIEDPQTGELISLIPVTHWYDGTPMTNSLCDGIIYFQGEPTDPDDYYKRYIEDHINVKWFGAKGNGMNDDTSNIQHAFDYLHDLRNYRNINDPSYDLCCLIPDGRYKITSTLLFPTSCVLKGESKHGTVLFTDRHDISILFPSEKGDALNDHHHREESDPYTNVGEEFTIISDLTIAGPYYGANPTGSRSEILNNFSNGILIYQTTKITLQNINIEGFENAGIHINNSFYVNIDNSTFINNKIGVLGDATTTTIYVVNSTFRLNSKAISLYNTYGCSFVNCIVEANIASYLPQINSSPEISKAIGVYLKDCKNISFTNSYFEAHLESIILDSSNSNIFTNCFFAPFENVNFGNNTKVVKFNGNSSYNKFIDNYYDAFDPLTYSPYKFSVEDKSLSKGNVFDFTLKDHFDNFISQNSTEFNDFITNNLKANAPKLICTGANEQFVDAERRYIIDKTFGSTSERPIDNLYKGQYYFDSTSGKPIFWQGTKWVYADGTNA